MGKKVLYRRNYVTHRSAIWEDSGYICVLERVCEIESSHNIPEDELLDVLASHYDCDGSDLEIREE